MPGPRKHHTVPQCHLRQFAGADGRLWEYEKGSGRVTRKRVEEVAAEHDFYSLEHEDGTLDLRVEEALAKIEGVAAEALRRLIAGEAPSPTDHGDIAYFLALQFVRTRSFRRGIAQGISADVRAMNAFLAQDDQAFDATIARYERHCGRALTAEERSGLRQSMADPGRFELGVSREATLAHAMHLIEPIGEVIRAMRWTLVDAEAGSFFITSDNPVVLAKLPGLIDRPPWDVGVGFGLPDACVTYPLTPALCLSACWFDDALARVTAPREQVADLNRMRAGSAERFLYADRESAEIAELARAVADPPPMLVTSGLGQDVDFAKVKVRRRRRPGTGKTLVQSPTPNISGSGAGQKDAKTPRR